jgi:hypothetical protein
MMISNPDDARKFNKMLEQLMKKLDFPKEMEKPGKDGSSLDSLIPNRIRPKGRISPR